MKDYITKLKARVPGEIRHEAQFLAGRHTPFAETVRLIRILMEFISGFRALQGVGPAVTVFGSARFKDGHPYYALAREIGAKLARYGFTVMTGAGPGLMEAANRGARDVGGKTFGCNIVLPHEQSSNPYLDKYITFKHFFVRKVMLVKYSYAFVILPGGMGTLDEASEAITLIQTGKLYDFPVVFVGKEYWKGFFDWIQGTLVKSGAIAENELSFIRITDSTDEVCSIIRESSDGIGLKLRPLPQTYE